MRVNRAVGLVILAVLLFTALASYAQLGPPPPPPPPPPADDGAPLNGEVFLLIGAGLLYARGVFKNNKEKIAKK